MKRTVAFITVLVLMLSLCACSGIYDQEFTKDGFYIELTSEFSEKAYKNYEAAYESKYILVLVIKEEFNNGPENAKDMSLDEYAQLMLLNCSKEGHYPSEIKRTEGVTHFVYGYNDKETGNSHKYFTAVYKGKDAFWTVQFATESEDYELFKDKILRYAKTVNVSE